MKKAISIKWIITLVFVLAMLLTTVGIGFLLLTSCYPQLKRQQKGLQLISARTFISKYRLFLHLRPNKRSKSKIIERHSESER